MLRLTETLTVYDLHGNVDEMPCDLYTPEKVSMSNPTSVFVGQERDFGAVIKKIEITFPEHGAQSLTKVSAGASYEVSLWLRQLIPFDLPINFSLKIIVIKMDDGSALIARVSLHDPDLPTSRWKVPNMKGEQAIAKVLRDRAPAVPIADILYMDTRIVSEGNQFGLPWMLMEKLEKAELTKAYGALSFEDKVPRPPHLDQLYI